MYPEVTVGALIFNEIGQVLLITGSKFKNYFVIPGGHIEYGEPMEKALIREVLEETGLKIYDISLYSLQEAISPEAYLEKKHFIYIDYICKSLESNVILNHEAQKYLWVLPEEALNMKTEEYTKGLISSWLQKNTIKTSIVYKPNV